MYVIHIIPVHDPPTESEPLDTICILPGMATFFENPSRVRLLPDSISDLTRSARPVVNEDHPPK